MTRVAGALALAVVLLLDGCRLIALGDSNTCFTTPCGSGTWPGVLQRRVWFRGWRVINRGAPGMTAGRFYQPPGERDLRTDSGEYAFAAFHVERMLAAEHLARACRWLVHPAFAPVVVLALGTHDVLWRDGETVARDVLALRDRIEHVAPCVRVFVGLIPPRADPRWARDAERVRANAALRARVPADRLVDFDTGFGASDFIEDGVHFDAAGQQKRADAVYRAVWGSPPSSP